MIQFWFFTSTILDFLLSVRENFKAKEFIDVNTVFSPYFLLFLNLTGFPDHLNWVSILAKPGFGSAKPVFIYVKLVFRSTVPVSRSINPFSDFLDLLNKFSRCIVLTYIKIAAKPVF